jgi:hypothetical protein
VRGSAEKIGVDEPHYTGSSGHYPPGILSSALQPGVHGCTRAIVVRPLALHAHSRIQKWMLGAAH